MATTPPTLTPVVGVPSTIPVSRLGTLTGVASYDGPYIGGATGLGLGQTPFKYDATFGGWVTADSPVAPAAAIPFTLPVARGDVVGSVAPTGWLIIDLTWQNQDGTKQNDRLTFRPQAGPGQVLDLSVSQAPLGYTTPQSLLDLITSTNSSKTNADTAAAGANTAAATVTAAVAAIPGQVATGLAPVAPALASMSQALADNAQTVAAAQAVTQAALVYAAASDAPDGGVILTFDVPQRPAAPSGLTISSQTATSLTLAWVDNTSDETGYGVQYSEDNLTWSYLVSNLAVNATSYTHTWTTEKEWYYRAFATTGPRRSAYSNTVQHAAPVPLGVQARWLFTEASGSALTDASGNSNAGTLTGGARRTGGGLIFNRNGYADFGALVAQANATNGLTVMIAAMIPAYATGDSLAQLAGRFPGSYSSTQGEWAMLVDQGQGGSTAKLDGLARLGSAVTGGDKGSGFDATSSTQSVQDGQPHWFTYVITPTGRVTSVDGVDVTESFSPSIPVPNSPTSGFRVGQSSGSGLGIRGEVYSVTVWPRVLSVSERSRYRQTERTRLGALSNPVVMPNV